MLKHLGSLPTIVEVTVAVAEGARVVVVAAWVIPRQEQADE